uniref:Uncharacterized protein n=1 Tax=Anguilla anguilla TaxID=7936 RepID=A0A0E9VFN9_ANGAN
MATLLRVLPEKRLLIDRKVYSILRMSWQINNIN